MKTLKTSLLFIAFLTINNTQTQACSFNASFTGDTMVCAGTSFNYLSKLTSGHYYRWAVNGGTIVFGQGTDSLWVFWPTPGTGSVELFDSTSSCTDSLTLTIHVGLSNYALTEAGFTVVGKATASGKSATLTDGGGNENSGAWNNYRINLNKNFDLNFTTNQNGSADGMMFVIQNSGLGSYSSGGQGSDLGYYNAGTGNMDESIGMEQDIYMSSSAYDDSSASHLNLVMGKSPTPIRKQVNISPALGGGSDHKLRVTWNRDANLLEIYFDGTKEFSWPNDIVKNVFGGNPNVWFGFTGATGGAASTQMVTTDTIIYNQAVINATSDTVCTGDSATLTSSYGVSYAWSNGAKTKSIKVGKSGMYSVTVTDSFNCSSTATINKNIVTLSTVSASFKVASGCVGTNVPITNNTTPTTGVRYMWKFGNGDSASGNPPSYAYKATGNYTVSVSATNGGCTSTASNPISVYTHPGGIVLSKSTPFQGQFNNGDVVTPDNVCLGDTNTYQFSPPTGYSNSNYGSKWVIAGKTFKTASGTISTDTVFKNPTSSKNAYFKFFPGSKFADSVLILTMHVQLLPGNCDTEIVRYIQARPNATSKFVFNNACQGFPLTFYDSSTIAKGDAVSLWSWNFGDGATSALQNPQHSYSKPGTYNVTLTATSNANCGIPVTKSVTEYPEAVGAFHAAAVCQQASSQFTDSSYISSGSIVTHAWNFGDGTSSTLKSPTHVYAKSGPYKVKLVVTSSFGCKDSITKSIRIEPAPVAALVYNDACVGTSINFANKTTDSATGTTYLWSFGDGSTSTAILPSHAYLANGTYKLKLTATSKYGCIDSVVQKVTPNPKPKVDFVYSGACTKNAVAFGDSDINGAGTTYTWSFGDGDSVALISDTISHIYNKSGIYKVELAVITAAGCEDTGSQRVPITGYPVASFLTPNVCEGKPLTFSNNSTGSGLTFSWNFGDSTSGSSNYSNLEEPTHVYDTAGIYTIMLAVTNSGKCTDTLVQTENVFAPPVVGKWNYKIHNQQVTFIPQDTTQKTYKWYFGTGDSSSMKKPAYTYQSKGKFDVKLIETNATGCSASYSDSITLTGLGVEPVIGPKNDLNISIFPNPFESKTTISYTLTVNSNVNISVYDIQGKFITELRNGNFEAGKYQDEFDASKCSASDGVYLVKMTVNGEVFTGRIVETK